MSEERLEESTVEDEGKKPSLFGMITSPTEQFTRIKKRPIIWGAMGILIVLFIIGVWLNALGVDVPPEVQELEIDEELAAGMQVFETMYTIIAGIFIPLFTVLIASFIHWLVAKVSQSTVSFKQLFSMNTYILIISAVGTILNGAFSALMGDGTGSMFTSLGSIIEVQGAMAGLFNSLEVFSIWTVIVTAIGLHKVADFSKGLAWTISILFFVIGAIFAMIGTGAAGMLGV